ncbi:MAG: hypothetical protein IVW57_10740 [Ktedonobacterales bacterium]|nr:hypothetical protein [Ktedonobacterales bacterium]
MEDESKGVGVMLADRAAPTSRGRRLAAALRADWHGRRVVSVGIALAALVTLVTLAYYLNHPAPDLAHDTASYILHADSILTSAQLVSAGRVPGYPLFLALIFALTGGHRLDVAQWVQAALFVVTVVELYALVYLATRLVWLAALAGVASGTNLVMLSYVKPIMSETLGLWLTITLALAVVATLTRPAPLTARRLWLIASLGLALVLTRPDWLLAPLLLLIYLPLVAARAGTRRRLLAHAAGAAGVVYATVGVYIVLNGLLNGYLGLAYVQNVNLYGKVIQYHMQDEAPAQYTALARVTDAYIARGITDPWAIIAREPSLAAHYAAPVGAYATAVIRAHPVEFLRDSVPVTAKWLVTTRLSSQPLRSGAFGAPLALLLVLSQSLFRVFIVFPFCAAGWWFVLVWRGWRSRAPDAPGRLSWLASPLLQQFLLVQRPLLLVLCALSLLAVYNLAETTLGSYSEYTRLHLAADPLMVAVLAGTVAAFLPSLTVALTSIRTSMGVAWRGARLPTRLRLVRLRLVRLSIRAKRAPYRATRSSAHGRQRTVVSTPYGHVGQEARGYRASRRSTTGSCRPTPL